MILVCYNAKAQTAGQPCQTTLDQPRRPQTVVMHPEIISREEKYK
jgi:hypothetical protein